MGEPKAETVIRAATRADQDGIWAIVRDVVSQGDTYPFSTDIDRTSAIKAWCELPRATYVAEHKGGIAGTYYLKDNQPSLGAHICNAGYMVAEKARGSGVGRAMCAHSLQAARDLGYHAMQYNLVVSTNRHAIKLWRSMGFEVVGTLSQAFNHRDLGYVDAYVMYRLL